MSDRDPLQSIWKSQSNEEFSMSLADIHARAEKFQSRVRTRNLIEYVAAATVIAFFIWTALITPALIVRIGAALIVLGALYVCWKLHELGRAASKAELDAAQSLTDFHRAELTRQRQALNTVWSWYLAPFIPGMVVFLAGVSFEAPPEAPLAAKLVVFLVGIGFVGALFWSVAWLNAQAVKKLDLEIRALDQS